MQHPNIDNFCRYQKHFKMIDMFPDIPGKCACGCGEAIGGRRTRWAEKSHGDIAYHWFMVIKGGVSNIRRAVFERDGGACRNCGVIGRNWEADHIVPVHKGGGGCGLENFQTLCVDCHKEKSIIERRNSGKVLNFA